jgi:hypothetical protein
LTRQVEIVMASVGVGCHFGSALVSERLFLNASARSLTLVSLYDRPLA